MTQKDDQTVSKGNEEAQPSVAVVNKWDKRSWTGVIIAVSVVILVIGLVTIFAFLAMNPPKMLSGEINGHQYVDLGLPSGVKWATCNVGASTPSDYGNYYAWGETATKPSYDEENSLTYGKSAAELRSAGIIDSVGNLTMSYDATQANWGGSWRMPTEQECEELKLRCTWTWTSQGGHNGYRVTGPNGQSIFLPAAGYRDGTSLNYVGECGYCWSSTRITDGDRLIFLDQPAPERSYGYVIVFADDAGSCVIPLPSLLGFAIRPVAE